MLFSQRRLVAFVASTLLSLELVKAGGEEVQFVVKVEPGRTECFFQPVKSEQYESFETFFQVLKGGDGRDIDFEIKSPSGSTLVDWKRNNRGTHSVSIRDNGYGDYQLCFGNSFSVQATKTVSVLIYIRDASGSFDAAFSTPSPLTNAQAGDFLFMEHTRSIKEKLNIIEQEQQKLRALEYIDRSIIETAFENVNLWGTVHTCVMIVAAMTQVFLVRSILSEDSKVGRAIRSMHFRSD